MRRSIRFSRNWRSSHASASSSSQRHSSESVYLSEFSPANSSDKLNMPQLGGHVTTGCLSIEHVMKSSIFQVGPVDQISRLRGLGRLESRPCVMWLHVDTIIRYSQEVPRYSEEDLGSDVVFWFDAGHVRDHSPLPVPFRTYCSILTFDLVDHFDVLQDR